MIHLLTNFNCETVIRIILLIRIIIGTRYTFAVQYLESIILGSLWLLHCCSERSFPVEADGARKSLRMSGTSASMEERTLARAKEGYYEWPHFDSTLLINWTMLRLLAIVFRVEVVCQSAA